MQMRFASTEHIGSISFATFPIYVSHSNNFFIRGEQCKNGTTCIYFKSSTTLYFLLIMYYS